MNEIVLSKPRHFNFRDAAPCADLKENDVRVRVRRIGVCGTDIHAYFGRQPFFTYPRVLGHELGVEVIETANHDPRLKPGTICAVEPYLNSPASQASRRGMTNCCENLNVLGVHIDGGMRPELVLPAHKLHTRESINIDQLALVETLCIGAHAVERGRPEPIDYCVVIGAGPIGLGCAAFARNHAGRVAVVDIQESRLAFCRDALGIPDTVDMGNACDTPLADRLRDISGCDLPSLIIDATGNARSMASCFDLAANGGRIVFAGLFQGDVSFHDPTFHRKELSILATRNATAQTFQSVMAAISSGKIDPEPWIGARVPFEEVPDKFAATVTTPGLIKAVIELN
ncbi:MAG: alcohol dehydrogenase catalytic domain-containing protein [Verrucomicrobiae bacterium]|nr:alcohol dehydrogenase catalytic domain-containing protein [Verrucomicrobiae bacterium]